MIIIRGEKRLAIDITKQEFDAIRSGIGHVQNIIPHIPPCEREFLITGVTPEEWGEIFGGCSQQQQCSYFIQHNLCKYNVPELKEEDLL